MKLDNLLPLYAFMKNNKINRYQFEFDFRGKNFDVLYFIDEIPNILAFGIKNHNYYFEMKVKKGFIIDAVLKDYNSFVRIMGFKYDANNKFKPSIFFTELNTFLPNVPLNLNNTPKPHEVAVYRNNVEEAEKIYFTGWINHKEGKGKVSPENLDKTRQLLAYEAYITCQNKNISSRWSAHLKDYKDYYEPS